MKTENFTTNYKLEVGGIFVKKASYINIK